MTDRCHSEHEDLTAKRKKIEIALISITSRIKESLT